MRKTYTISEVIEREKIASKNRKQSDQNIMNKSKPKFMKTSLIVPIVDSMQALFIFMGPFSLLFSKLD